MENVQEISEETWDNIIEAFHAFCSKKSNEHDLDSNDVAEIIVEEFEGVVIPEDEPWNSEHAPRKRARHSRLWLSSTSGEGWKMMQHMTAQNERPNATENGAAAKTRPQR